MHIFGARQPGIEYRPRPAVYAVIFNNAGQVAMVREAQHFFLPGGGIENDESLEAALEREVREECCWSIEIGQCIGEAVQYFVVRDHGYASHGTYFTATISGIMDGTPEHHVTWFDPGDMLDMYHAAHRWALEQAILALKS